MDDSTAFTSTYGISIYILITFQDGHNIQSTRASAMIELTTSPFLSFCRWSDEGQVRPWIGDVQIARFKRIGKGLKQMVATGDTKYTEVGSMLPEIFYAT